LQTTLEKKREKLRFCKTDTDYSSAKHFGIAV